LGVLCSTLGLTVSLRPWYDVNNIHNQEMMMRFNVGMVETWLVQNERSRNWLAKRVSLSNQTMGRILTAKKDPTLSEVGAIALAMGLPELALIECARPAREQGIPREVGLVYPEQDTASFIPPESPEFACPKGCGQDLRVCPC
jgi:DNA-binding phage protein